MALVTPVHSLAGRNMKWDITNIRADRYLSLRRAPLRLGKSKALYY